jgi:hypothetical protein
MAEEITFSQPIQADPGASRFRVSFLGLDWENAAITIKLREWNGTAFLGRLVHLTYDGPVATTMMRGLNKANLTTQSLHQRVIERLITDGKLPAGTQTGAPD